MSEYTYRAQWAPDYGGYLGLCLEFPTLSARGITACEAIAAVEKMAAQELQDRMDCDTPAPQSPTDRHYGGSFMVRTSPALHARLMVEATEQRVSMNQWVVQKLAGRPPVLDDFF